MCFYAFLALTLFRSFARYDYTKREEFIDTDSMTIVQADAKFDFDEGDTRPRRGGTGCLHHISWLCGRSLNMGVDVFVGEIRFWGGRVWTA
ncbi:hypothetical protein AAFF_G00107440 [Aldrovandia affinis]|uniref:Uncharacterized protein n=1 Tax=Aldrovandia affinis TaxID=143900 RepID=A0AAD7RUA7_9TELE|nr:hypothetical protein AAFF_G00107440 [Aldrovandia affinis]